MEAFILYFVVGIQVILALRFTARNTDNKINIFGGLVGLLIWPWLLTARVTQND